MENDAKKVNMAFGFLQNATKTNNKSLTQELVIGGE